MIIVSILRHESDGVYGFEIKGHANFAKRGQDIVCAGVSAITVGTVNAIESLIGVHMDSVMKDGFLNARLPLGLSSDAKEKSQLLLSAMIVMLQGIEGSYNKYIKIRDIIT